MNTLHPTIAQSLLPCTPPGAVAASLYRWARPAPAAAPCGYKPTRDELRGRYEYSYTTSGGLKLACYLDYEAPEPQTHDDQGWPERIELVYALVGGIDISEVLGDLCDDIETKALADLKAEAAEATLP